MNLFKFALPILLCAGAESSAETVKYISTAACTAAFTKAPVSGFIATTYCADKIMSFAEACEATKISEYLTANGAKAITDLTTTEQTRVKSKYKYECQLAAQKESASSAQTAKQAADAKEAQDNARKAALVAAGVAVAASGTSHSLANAQTAVKVAQAGVQISENVDKKVAAANGGGNRSAVASNSANASAANNSSTVANAASGANSSGGVVAATDKAIADATVGSARDLANQGSTDVAAYSQSNPNSVNYVNSMDAQSDAAAMARETTQSAQTASIQQGQAAQPLLLNQGGAVTTELPGTEAAVSKVQENAAGGASGGANQAIVAEEQQASTTLSTTTTTQATSTKTSATGLPVPFSFTSSAITTYEGQLKSYLALKKTCGANAATASYLCVEDTSPGAIAAKELMNAAGPIMAAITTAQRACSSAAKVSQFVNTGLMVAKGVCVGAKVICDTSCAAATKALAALNQSLATIPTTAISTDRLSGLEYCAGANVAYAACAAGVEAKAQALTGMIATLKTTLAKESTPTPGTSTALVAQCGSMAKDIVLFATQLVGTWAARQNAKACEQKLTTGDGSGTSVTTQQFCEKAENATAQLCICQKNNMAPNCPGALAAAGTPGDPAKNSTNQAGFNLKNGAGVSAFATTGNPVAMKSNLPNGSKNGLGGGSAGSAAAAGAGGAADASGGGSAGGVGGSGAGGGSAPAGSGDSKIAGGLKEEDKKKWSFGAFAAATGGSGGSGYNANSASGRSGGKITTTGKDEASIQRQIASEQFAVEVSTASGKSNWEKVRNMYLIKEGSFILGQ